jgi:DNA replication protein DnaC
VLLAHHLKALRLPTFLREYDKLARQCAAEGLLRLAELEMIERERRTVERRIKEARLPAVKSLDSFDFAAIPSLNKTLVLELARSEGSRAARTSSRSATAAPARLTPRSGSA